MTAPNTQIVPGSISAIAELEAERDEAQKMYERLMNTAFYHETILPNGNLGVNVLEVCEGLQEAHEEIVHLSRWVERLVEVGKELDDWVDFYHAKEGATTSAQISWRKLVAEWNEHKK